MNAMLQRGNVEGLPDYGIHVLFQKKYCIVFKSFAAPHENSI